MWHTWDIQSTFRRRPPAWQREGRLPSSIEHFSDLFAVSKADCFSFHMSYLRCLRCQVVEIDLNIKFKESQKGNIIQWVVQVADEAAMDGVAYVFSAILSCASIFLPPWKCILLWVGKIDHRLFFCLNISSLMNKAHTIYVTEVILCSVG
jgi:hypothetical protein